jgi:hypothetical protein
MLWVAIGAGGIGVAVNGILADTYSLSAALATIPALILVSAGIILMVRYPWRALERRGERTGPHFGR